jgi:hypothetical protein
VLYGTDDTIGYTLHWGDELGTGIILARWHGPSGGFAAHGAFIAFWAVGSFVWSVLGARRSPLTSLDGLAKFQQMHSTPDMAPWNMAAYNR